MANLAVANSHCLFHSWLGCLRLVRMGIPILAAIRENCPHLPSRQHSSARTVLTVRRSTGSLPASTASSRAAVRRCRRNARSELRCRFRRGCGQRPTHDHLQAQPRLSIVGDKREVTAQFDHARQLAPQGRRTLADPSNLLSDAVRHCGTNGVHSATSYHIRQLVGRIRISCVCPGSPPSWQACRIARAVALSTANMGWPWTCLPGGSKHWMNEPFTI